MHLGASLPFCCLSQSGFPAHGEMLSIFRAVLPTSFKACWKPPHRHTQWFVSQAILGSVKWTIHIKSHSALKSLLSFESRKGGSRCCVFSSSPLPLTPSHFLDSLHYSSVFSMAVKTLGPRAAQGRKGFIWLVFPRHSPFIEGSQAKNSSRTLLAVHSRPYSQLVFHSSGSSPQAMVLPTVGKALLYQLIIKPK